MRARNGDHIHVGDRVELTRNLGDSLGLRCRFGIVQHLRPSGDVVGVLVGVSRFLVHRLDVVSAD